MKKVQIFIGVLVCMLAVFISCSESSDSTTQSLRQPRVGEINLVGVTNPSISETSRTPVSIIIIDIARRKHSDDPTVCGDCKCGLGICRFCFFCTRTNAPTEAQTTLYLENGQYFFEVALTSPRISGVDYNFYIDQDERALDADYVIPKATYTLDTSIGAYGGYKILVNKI